jgi:hypothetical protein
MTTTLVLNKQGKYEAMYVSPREVREVLVNMYMPNSWNEIAVNINLREERWVHKPTDIEVLFSVDTSLPFNPVRLVLTKGNVVLVQAEMSGLDAIGYACVIGELINNCKDA